MTVDWIILTYGVTKYDSRYNKGIHISEFAVYDVFVSKHKSHPISHWGRNRNFSGLSGRTRKLYLPDV